MSPRKASLRVAHQKACAQRAGGKDPSSLESLKGCTCRPAYYVFHRTRRGATVKGERYTDRLTADRKLIEKQRELDEGRAGFVKPKTIEFSAWVGKWGTLLEDARRKGATRRAYVRSAEYAAETIAGLDLREVGNDELRQVVRFLRDDIGMTDITVAKHLRHLSVCFEAAMDEDYLDRNPVGRFRRTFKLDVQDSEANYFTNGELSRLWAQMRAGLPKKDGTVAPVAPVYLALCQFAVATGARIGELIAARWSDVDLSDSDNGTLRISKTWNAVDGETTPKTKRSNRTVHLTVDARRVLDEWAKVHGDPFGDALLFPSPKKGTHLSQSVVSNRVLVPALKAAGIPTVGEGSLEPRSFHTFRHCYARLMLEPPVSQPLQWVADELGHSSVLITQKVYGHWARSARHEAAARVPEGSLPT